MACVEIAFPLGELFETLPLRQTANWPDAGRFCFARRFLLRPEPGRIHFVTRSKKLPREYYNPAVAKARMLPL
jgi:hypothetical protein